MKEIRLGKTLIPSSVFLAPMAGITDLPFRKIVRSFGDFMVFSEMIASNAVIQHVARSFKMLEGSDDPYSSVQIVGADPKVMAEAAILAENLGAKFIDINMGCPVKKIVKSEAGSALMKDEKLATAIIDAVIKAVKIPVTLKIRLGWDQHHKNAPRIAKIAEDLGIQLISVHARTRSQFFSGQADWKAIREVKEAVKIPVIANGDINSVEAARQSLEESQADGVMIGRGALGSPWLLLQVHNDLSGISIDPISNSFKLETAKRHLQLIQKFYDKEQAILLGRKALMYYCKGIPNAASFRNLIFRTLDFEQLFSFLDQMFN